MYAIVLPEVNGRQQWEQTSSFGHAKQIAAFYRYTYGHVAEVWTLQWSPKTGTTLGKCLKREVIDDTHPYRGVAHA